MSTRASRRRLLGQAAAGAFLSALPQLARAQGTPPPAPRGAVPPAEHTVTAPVAIEVNARRITSFEPRDRTRVRFGALEFRSGLVLTSPYRGFGGLSGLRFRDSRGDSKRGERFLAISDQGAWFTGRLRYDGRALAGLDEVEAAPMLDAEGRPITEKKLWYDTESLALDGNLAYVGLERVNALLRFDLASGLAEARGEVLPLPAAARKLPFNKGLEALVAVPKGLPLAGTLLALSERGLDRDGNLVAFLLGGPRPGQFAIRRTDHFDISDAVLLPSGELLILERKFSWFTGVNIRIRAIPLRSIAPNALVDGPALFDADHGHEIDNMEGIDAHVGPDGETVLTLVSDDNFSMLQRTLLLQFTLVE